MAILLGGYALPLLGLLRLQGPPMEEGFMLVFPERLLAGDVPHVDFLHLYGPGSLWVLAGAFEVFGTSLATERFVALATQLGIVFALFALALPWGRRVATLGGLVATLVVIPPNGLTALPWNGAVALGLVALAVGLPARRLDQRMAGRRLLAAGVLGGFALLYRPDLVVAITLGGAVAAWGLPRRQVLRLLGGLAIGVAPFLVHLARSGVGDAVRGMVLEPVFELRPGRRLPIPPPWDGYDSFLQQAGALREPPWPFPAPSSTNQIFLWCILTVVAAVFVAGVGAWAVRRDRSSYRARVLLAVGAFSVGLLPQALQRPDTTHFAWVSSVSLGFAAAAVAEVLRTHRPRWSGGRRGVLAGAVVVAVVLGVIPHFTARSYADITRQSFGRSGFGFDVNNDGRNFYLGSPEAADAAQAVVDDLDERSRPGERLFVGTVDLRFTPYSDAFLYFLLPELEPATRYIEMDPGVANAPDSGLADDVASADWLILSAAWVGWDEPNASRDPGPDEPNLVVRHDFCLIGEHGGLFELYERCDGPPRRP